MPSEGPGARFSCVATKASVHGNPVVELGHAGIVAKSAQAAPAAVSVANATAAQQIGIGEEQVVMMEGLHTFGSALLPGGAAAGNPLYIRASDNALVLAATALTAGVLNAGFWKFGLISEIDTVLARVSVNLSRRDSF